MGSSMPAGWENALAEDLGAAPSKVLTQFFDEWALVEHGSESGPWGGVNQGGAYNPFDTTLPEPGASTYNSIGVKNYVSASQGLSATASTLEEPAYTNLLEKIRSGDSTLASLEEAENATPWGTTFPDVGTPPPASSSGSSSSSVPAETTSFLGIPNPFSGAENAVLSFLAEMAFVGIGGALVVVGGYKAAGKPVPIKALAGLAAA